jgi:hypothetical protein
MAQLETAQASSGAELFVVGEYWSDSYVAIISTTDALNIRQITAGRGVSSLVKKTSKRWILRREFTNSVEQSKTVVIRLFDVPLHYNFHHASILGTRFDLRKILQGSLMLSSSRHAVTFVDNHDTVGNLPLEISLGLRIGTAT